MNIGLVIPFYNEKENLIFFVKEWEKYLSEKENIRDNLTFFFFDDGSKDSSSDAILENIKKINYKIIRKKNSGHGDTCRYGYKYILENFKNCEFILQIDSDNQCDPKYLEKFMNLAQNNNFVFGFRRIRDDGVIRLITSRIMSIFFFIKKGFYIKDLNTPYRMMNSKQLNKIVHKIETGNFNKNLELYNCLLSYQIIKNYDIKWIDITFRERYFGKSKFNFKKMFYMFLNFIIKV